MKCLDPADHHPARIRKVDKTSESKMDFKDIKFPFKIRDINNFFDYENKEKYPLYVSKDPFKKHVDLFLEEEKHKKSYVLVKEFNIIMHDHFLYRERKHTCRHYFQPFSTEEKLKCHINDYFEVNSKQKIKKLKKINMLDSKVMNKK